MDEALTIDQLHSVLVDKITDPCIMRTPFLHAHLGEEVRIIVEILRQLNSCRTISDSCSCTEQINLYRICLIALFVAGSCCLSISHLSHYTV